MKKTIRIFLSTLLLLTFSFVTNGQVTRAATDVGGSVSVKGTITFYEGEEPPIKKAETKPEPNKTPKPPLPKTGENGSSSYYLGMGVLTLLGAYMVVIKVRRRLENES